MVDKVSGRRPVTAPKVEGETSTATDQAVIDAQQPGGWKPPQNVGQIDTSSNSFQVKGGSRVQGVALSLQGEEGFNHRLFMLSEQNGMEWAAVLARRTIQQQVPLVIADAALDGELAATMPHTTRAALCVPLFVGEGPGASKLTKAEELGVPILDEAGFAHLLETGELPATGDQVTNTE